MKKSKKINIVVLLFTCILFINNCVAQFAILGAGNNSGHTVPSIETVGIGTNSSYNNIRAVLYVNSNLVSTSTATPVVNPGDVFGTDCPTGTGSVDISAWRMNRNGTEMFNVSNPYNSNNMLIGTVQNGSFNIFTNGSSNIRMTIDAAGKVGIGVTPAHQLDVLGEINIGGPTNYYQIDGYTVLHNYGNTSFFAGVFAGNPTITYTGQANTAVGFWAGNGITSGNANSFYGYRAGYATTGGLNNVFFGNQAGENNTSGSRNVIISSGGGNSNLTGNNNVFIGNTAGRLNTVSDNVFIGNESGFTNATGIQNTFLGTQSGKNNTGSDNTFTGCKSGFNNSSGTRNTFIGSFTGNANTKSDDNTFIGYNSGVVNTAAQNTFFGSKAGLVNTSGMGNTFVGYLSGSATTTGGNNTLLGINSGLNTTTGTNNTFIGNTTAGANTTGSYNTVLGDAAGCTATLNHQTAIGDAACARVANTMILGNNSVKVGIGLSGDPVGPQRKLEILDGSATEQMRLSYANGSSAKWTDFEVTSSGDLNIKPRSLSGGTTSLRRVGINTNSPRTALEINTPDASPTVSGGNSGLQFTDLTTASTINTSAFPGMPKGVLSVNADGKVILVPDEGNGTVDACTGSGGIKNYLSKFDSPFDICISTIWENDFSTNANTNVGVHTMPANVPVYNFHNLGTSMFAKNAMSSALTNYNSTSYPLNVLTNNGAGGTTGIGIHSNGTYTGSPGRDELNIYVDDNGQTVFRSLWRNTDFRSITNSTSMLGLVPADHSAVMKDDFSTNPSQPSSQIAKLYVEAQTSNPSQFYSIWANNTNTNYSANDRPAAIFGETTTARSVVNTGIFAKAENSSSDNIGIFSMASSSFTTGWNRGGTFYSNGGYNCSGVEGAATGGSNINYGGFFFSHGSTVNYGVRGRAENGTTNYGVHGSTDGTSSSTNSNYAIYGVTTQNTSPCTTTGCTQAAGYFNGDVFVTSGGFITSDSLLKTNISIQQNNSHVLSQLKVYTYEFDTTKTQGMNVPSGMQIGLLSQQVQQVLPGLVKGTVNPDTRDSAGVIIYPKLNYLALNYTGIIPVLVGGHNEQQELIDSLTLRITNLETIVYNCCNSLPKSSGQNTRENNTQSTELKNVPVTTIFLDQNKPNPFADQTDIDYYLPDEVRIAEMLFNDQTGNIIKTVTLRDRGKGTLHVYSPELKTGTYTYSLVADGQVVETKTMVKTR